MPFERLLLRFVALALLAVWMGGFTFYASAVVPALHDEFGSLMGSYVTRRVTNTLNGIGLAAVAAWWVLIGVERRALPRGWWWARFGLLFLSTATLAALFALHVEMDARLETGSLRGFYPWHRAYLIVSTVQWAANLGAMLASIRLWGQALVPGPEPGRGDTDGHRPG